MPMAKQMPWAGWKMAVLDLHGYLSELKSVCEELEVSILAHPSQARLDMAEAQLLEARDNVANTRLVLRAMIGVELSVEGTPIVQK